MSRDVLINIKDALKDFGVVKALNGVDLEVLRGEVVLIIGPSGSGKSTLLRSVNKLEVLTEGSITIDGDPVTGPGADIRQIREEVGMVFQSFNLFPHLNVLDNIILAPRKVKKISKPDAEAIARKLLDKVGLGDREKAFPPSFPEGRCRESP